MNSFIVKMESMVLKHESLILSEFAGSAPIFKKHELLVNPWNYNQCTEAINAALSMSMAARETNWKRLRDLKSPYTAIEWHDLKETGRTQQPRHINKTSPLSFEDLKSS
jgi:trehalose-6-phosphate synthase